MSSRIRAILLGYSEMVCVASVCRIRKVNIASTLKVNYFAINLGKGL